MQVLFEHLGAQILVVDKYNYGLKLPGRSLRYYSRIEEVLRAFPFALLECGIRKNKPFLEAMKELEGLSEKMEVLKLAILQG